MGWNLPDGCTDRMIDEAAGGYDLPECECEYDEERDEIDRSDCPVHRAATGVLSVSRGDVETGIDDCCPF